MAASVASKGTVIGSRIAIAAQFAALLRCLAQFFWLEYSVGALVVLSRVRPFILGALVTAFFLVISVAFSFFNKPRAAIATAALNIVALFILKFWLM
ncbi:MAG TPA: hypothetical protein VJR23_13965 [Candidatus Acidoferrales bacterium]|nr:hypothetical protein [Candidatus Acidoferrales bacterium]